MKFEVKYVEFEFPSADCNMLYECFVKDFGKIFKKYASNTCITQVSEYKDQSKVLEKITLQKSISLNTLNNVLKDYLNDLNISAQQVCNMKFIFENINFEYVNFRAKIKVGWC